MLIGIGLVIKNLTIVVILIIGTWQEIQAGILDGLKSIKII